MPFFIFELYFSHSDSNSGKFRQRLLPVNGSLGMYFFKNTGKITYFSLQAKTFSVSCEYKIFNVCYNLIR